MTELRTRLGPLLLKNPVMAASSEVTIDAGGIRACIDAGAAAVVAKSVNESPDAARQLNIADYALIDPTGEAVPWPERVGNETLLCRSGLAQPTIDDWLAMLEDSQHYARSHDAHVIGSITVASVDGAERIAGQMAEVVPAIELNVGAPHGREAKAVRQITGAELVGHYTRTIREAADVPLIVKLPAQADSPFELAQAAYKAGADVVAMIGRFNGFWPQLSSEEPLLGSWGAVGGPGFLPVSLYWVSKTHTTEPTMPLIGTNGARTGSDIARFLLSGASAVELATAVLLRGPRVLEDCIRELDETLAEAGFESVESAIGAAARRSRAYSDIPPRNMPFRPWDE